MTLKTREWLKSPTPLHHLFSFVSMVKYGMCMRDAGCEFDVYQDNLYACHTECKASNPGAVCTHPDVKSNRRIKAVLKSRAVTTAKNTVIIALTNTGYVPYIKNLHQVLHILTENVQVLHIITVMLQQSMKHLQLEKHLITFALQQVAKHLLEATHVFKTNIFVFVRNLFLQLLDSSSLFSSP